MGQTGNYQWHLCKCPKCGRMHRDLVTVLTERFSPRKGAPYCKVVCDHCYDLVMPPGAVVAYKALRQRITDNLKLTEG